MLYKHLQKRGFVTYFNFTCYVGYCTNKAPFWGEIPVKHRMINDELLLSCVQP
jgi:hypothetical protein